MCTFWMSLHPPVINALLLYFTMRWTQYGWWALLKRTLTCDFSFHTVSFGIVRCSRNGDCARGRWFQVRCRTHVFEAVWAVWKNIRAGWLGPNLCAVARCRVPTHVPVSANVWVQRSAAAASRRRRVLGVVRHVSPQLGRRARPSFCRSNNVQVWMDPVLIPQLVQSRCSSRLFGLQCEFNVGLYRNPAWFHRMHSALTCAFWYNSNIIWVTAISRSGVWLTAF